MHRHTLRQLRGHRRLALQHRAQRRHILRPFARAHAEHPGHHRQEARRHARHRTLFDLPGIALQRPRGGRCGRHAEEQEVNHRAQRVEVGPGALAHGRHVGVLLDRCVTGFQDRGERLRAVTDDAPRCAEVEQDGRALGRQQDVVGRDVAVEHPFVVQPLQRVEHRLQDAADPGFVGRIGHGAPRIAQRDALQVRHDHVGGRIVLPEAVHLDQRRVVEARQHAGLVDERAQADRVGFGE